MEADDYMLGSAVECERLERQADLHGRERIFTHVALSPGQVFLDAGSGSGASTRAVARRFPQAQVIGVDINPDYVAFATRRAAEENLSNVSFRVGNLQRLDLAPASVDVVWSQFVLYFVPDPQATLAEFARVARPGGSVIAATHELPARNWPAPESIQPEFDRLVSAILGGWQSRRLPGMLAKAGLVDIGVNIEFDTIYSKLPGPFAAASRRNFEEVLAGPVPRLAAAFGGEAKLRRLIADWFDYMDRPETTSVGEYWVARGRVPS